MVRKCPRVQTQGSDDGNFCPHILRQVSLPTKRSIRQKRSVRRNLEKKIFRVTLLSSQERCKNTLRSHKNPLGDRSYECMLAYGAKKNLRELPEVQTQTVVFCGNLLTRYSGKKPGGGPVCDCSFCSFVSCRRRPREAATRAKFGSCSLNAPSAVTVMAGVGFVGQACSQYPQP